MWGEVALSSDRPGGRGAVQEEDGGAAFCGHMTNLCLLQGVRAAGQSQPSLSLTLCLSLSLSLHPSLAVFLAPSLKTRACVRGAKADRMHALLGAGERRSPSAATVCFCC